MEGIIEVTLAFEVISEVEVVADGHGLGAMTVEREAEIQSATSETEETIEEALRNSAMTAAVIESAGSGMPSGVADHHLRPVEDAHQVMEIATRETFH